MSFTHSIGAVSSARFAIMVVILSVGEILVGAWSSVVPLEVESTLRALVALATGLGIMMAKKKVGVESDRPAL